MSNLTFTSNVTFTVDCGFVYNVGEEWLVRDKNNQYVGAFKTEEEAKKYAIESAIQQLNVKDYV